MSIKNIEILGQRWHNHHYHQHHHLIAINNKWLHCKHTHAQKKTKKISTSLNEKNILRDH